VRAKPEKWYQSVRKQTVDRHALKHRLTAWWRVQEIDRKRVGGFFGETALILSSKRTATVK
jgi:hypothetical protein